MPPRVTALMDLGDARILGLRSPRRRAEAIVLGSSLELRIGTDTHVFDRERDRQEIAALLKRRMQDKDGKLRAALQRALRRYDLKRAAIDRPADPPAETPAEDPVGSAPGPWEAAWREAATFLRTHPGLARVVRDASGLRAEADDGTTVLPFDRRSWRQLEAVIDAAWAERLEEEADSHLVVTPSGVVEIAAAQLDLSSLPATCHVVLGIMTDQHLPGSIREQVRIKAA